MKVISQVDRHHSFKLAHSNLISTESSQERFAELFTWREYVTYRVVISAQRKHGQRLVRLQATLLGGPESMKRVGHCVIPMPNLPEVWFGTA
jgi:hypothetical protein